MGINYTISFDIGQQLDFTAVVNKEVFPLLNQAVRAVVQGVANNWRESVKSSDLWSGERDAYAASIHWEMTGDFAGFVEATYKHAEAIETGRPAYDMKQMLNTSQQVRRTTKGKRFLVIPLRHNISKLQAAGIYDDASALAASMIVGESDRPSGEVTHLSPSSGMSPAAKQSPYLSNPATKGSVMVKRNSYAWGGKMKGGPSWAKGMTRFDTSTPGSPGSSYMTFRIMMEGQSKWVMKPKPGLFLAKKVADDMRPKAQSAFAEAIKRQIPKGG